MSNHRAILIAGPTASGKSAVALELATKLGGAVINADSMQVYSDLRILSARPSDEDQARAPHSLYGFIPAAHAYSVGQWLGDVQGAINEAVGRGQMPIITGGTGLYFKALIEGLSPVPDIPDEVRQRWRGMIHEKSPDDLHGILHERDPEMAAKLRPSDTQRVTRALEVLEATGRSLAEWQNEPGTPLIPEHQVVRVFVEPPREILYERIDARFDAMLDEGALEEVKSLGDQKLSSELPAMRALGVKPLLSFLNGEMGREESVENAKTETRRYAKRQLTWSRSNMITWKRMFVKDSESMMAKIISFIDV